MRKLIRNNINTIIIIGVVIIAIVIAIIANPVKDKEDSSNSGIFNLFPSKTKEHKVYENPQVEDPNYKGSYDEKSGKVKIVKFFDGKSKEIDNCTFSDVKFSFSPSNSSFSGRFVSHDDKITGTVYIEFTLYDKNKNVVKKFHNRLLNVKKGEERIVLAEYRETIDNVASVEMSIKK